MTPLALQSQPENSPPGPSTFLSLLTSDLPEEWFSLEADPSTLLPLSAHESAGLQQLDEDISAELERLFESIQSQDGTLQTFTSDDVTVNVSDRVRFTFLQSLRKQVHSVLSGKDLNPELYPSGDRVVHIEEGIEAAWCRPAREHRAKLAGRKEKRCLLHKEEWLPAVRKSVMSITSHNALPDNTVSNDRRMINAIVSMAVRAGTGIDVQDNLFQAALSIRYLLKKSPEEREAFLV